MKKILLIISLLLISNTCLAAEKDWLGIPKDNLALAILAVIPVGVDWATTMDIRRKFDQGYSEKNPLIGKYPKRSDINRFFITKLVIHYIINTNKYTSDYKNIWNIHLNITHAKAAFGNISAGLSIKF